MFLDFGLLKNLRKINNHVVDSFSSLLVIIFHSKMIFNAL